MEILEGQSAAQPQRICIYGDSGGGKTTLAVMMARLKNKERWGSRYVYACWDKSSDSLDSIPHDIREKLLVMRPTINAAGKLDPHKEAFDMAGYPFPSKYPDVKTILWDGGTEMADMLLRAYANAGVFSGGSGDKHISVGDRGSASYMALPMMGDYGAAQNGALAVVERLALQPLNLIFICQPDILVPEGNPSAMVGGPVLVGGKSINRLHSKFNTVVRVVNENVQVPDNHGTLITRVKYRALTEKRGIWLAKLRKPVDMENPIPDMDITGNPLTWWEAFDGLQDKLWNNGE